MSKVPSCAICLQIELPIKPNFYRVVLKAFLRKEKKKKKTQKSILKLLFFPLGLPSGKLLEDTQTDGYLQETLSTDQVSQVSPIFRRWLCCRFFKQYLMILAMFGPSSAPPARKGNTLNQFLQNLKFGHKVKFYKVKNKFVATDVCLLNN
jgi:hypothetical protein